MLRQDKVLCEKNAQYVAPPEEVKLFLAHMDAKKIDILPLVSLLLDLFCTINYFTLFLLLYLVCLKRRIKVNVLSAIEQAVDPRQLL